jgi:hypothetical protein
MCRAGGVGAAGEKAQTNLRDRAFSISEAFPSYPDLRVAYDGDPGSAAWTSSGRGADCEKKRKTNPITQSVFNGLRSSGGDADSPGAVPAALFQRDPKLAVRDPAGKDLERRKILRNVAEKLVA